MLKEGKRYFRLPIVLSPDGEFYTPTTPPNYTEANAMADCLLGRKSYFFQKLVAIKHPFWRRLVWRATEDVADLEDDDVLRWDILAGRPFKMPRPITPRKAEELAQEAYREREKRAERALRVAQRLRERSSMSKS